MLTPATDTSGRKERRVAERRPCSPETTCEVTDALDQSRAPAAAWNLSPGGTGLVIEAHLPRGSRVTVELHHPARADDLLAWAEVKHALCCPSFHEMWLTGCSFLETLPGTDLSPYV